MYISRFQWINAPVKQNPKPNLEMYIIKLINLLIKLN